MNHIKLVFVFLGSFILSVLFLSCVVEDSTAENCNDQIDSSFGEYEIFKKIYEENETPLFRCDTGPDNGTVLFDGDKFIIEYQNDEAQNVVVTYDVVYLEK